MPFLTGRAYYKPFEYPWAFDNYLVQNQVAWLPEEVPLHEDVKDWNFKLTDNERHFLTQLFRFFTQADVDVSQSYIDKFLVAFGNIPEIRMMLLSFANIESVHAHSYSLLLDTIGMPEIEYKAFLQYEAMKNKHDFIGQFNVDNEYEMAKSMAIISGGIEGVQLFSSFAMLLNFPRHNKMKGMGQIITWSVRDESLHVEGMSNMFKAFVKERMGGITKALKADVYGAFEEIVKQEDAFIDLSFEMGAQDEMTPEEVKQYIRFIADRRLIGLGMKGIFQVKKNPLTWLDHILNGEEHVNFFENRATEYSKAASQGDWGDVWSRYDVNKLVAPEYSIIV